MYTQDCTFEPAPRLGCLALVPDDSALQDMGEVMEMSPNRPQHDPEDDKGWDQYRLYVVNTLNQIQLTVVDVKTSLKTELDGMNVKLTAMEERIRKLENKSSVWALLAGNGAALLAFAYIVIERIVKGP